MRTLVIDTETNGLRKRGETALADEPFMLQLAAALFDGERLIQSYSAFTLPVVSGVVAHIPKEQFFIDAGLTEDIILAYGVSYHTALGVLEGMASKCDRIVAHNAAFDVPVVRAAYLRSAQTSKNFREKPKFCTMISLTNVLKIPKRTGGFKWPTLQEAYKALVHEKGFKGAHDALVDVRACAKVLFEMEKRGLPLTEVEA